MRKNILKRAFSAVALLVFGIGTEAAEAVYRIVEYNKSTGEFTLAASGMVPKGSWVYFENEYGATTGNRFNQIPRNRQASLYLEGWQGCTIKSVTLSMCSNNKSGQVGLSLSDGDTQLYSTHPVDFADASWFGQWVSKDLGVYVDIKKPFDVPALASDEATLTLKGGTAEGSVYLSTITIDYDEAPGATLESPLGWSYEKLTKKSTLTEGDELMIYRNGCAAADLGGMDESHYLDVVTLASTSDVASHDVLRFTLGKAADSNQWTLTDQYGRLLTATGKQALAWNEGVAQWTIDLGYDGAVITNGNAAYGTLRYNAPEESYARFNVYTSTSLPLPFLYRKDKQKTPVVSTSLSFAEPTMTANLADAHIALVPELSPSSVTDRRLAWQSSDEGVATVNGGFVSLLKAGQTIISARSLDGGAEANIVLNVEDASCISSPSARGEVHVVRKLLDADNRIVITSDGSYKFYLDGRIK